MGISKCVYSIWDKDLIQTDKKNVCVGGLGGGSKSKV